MIVNTPPRSPGFADSSLTQTSLGISVNRVLGVPVSIINLPVAVRTILGWVRERRAQYVCVRDVHGIMRSQEDPALMSIHEHAGLVTPDGMPLVWLAWYRGYKTIGRVCGADLVAELADASQAVQARHYFYGGNPGVAERMAAVLKARYPKIEIAGCMTPPFRTMSPQEDSESTESIAATLPDIVWVGLSTPKQEFWMRDHVGRIPGATLLGVGAAFDFWAGDVRRAPRWMHNSGLEWSYRLVTEPRRLWKRYLVLAPKFALLVALRRKTLPLQDRR